MENLQLKSFSFSQMKAERNKRTLKSVPHEARRQLSVLALFIQRRQDDEAMAYVNEHPDLDLSGKIWQNRQREEETYLHIACRSDCPRMVAHLLTCNGVDVNAKDQYGVRPVHHAIQLGSPGLLRTMLQDTRVVLDRNTFSTYVALGPRDETKLALLIALRWSELDTTVPVQQFAFDEPRPAAEFLKDKEGPMYELARKFVAHPGPTRKEVQARFG
jgi:ankyrin repeat protein